MSVPCLRIADAIVTALTGATFSQSIAFERVYVPKFDLANAATIQGKVSPRSDMREMGSAANDNATIVIDIGVLKRLQNTLANQQTELDALLLLCEEIKAVINRERLADAEEAICIGTAQEMPYAVEYLDEMRVFLAIISTTFLTTVAI